MRFGTLILISIVFTKSPLTTTEIGSYEIFIFIAGLLSSFWINGLIQSFLPLFAKNRTFGEDRRNNSPILFNVFILLSLFSVLAILILLIFRNRIETSFNQSAEIKYFQLLLIYIFFSSPSYLIEYVYLLKNKSFSILIYGLISFFVQFTVISLPAVLNRGMYYCIVGLVFVSIIRYGWLLIILLKYSQPVLSVRFIREHLHFGYPLIISAFLGSSAQYVDGFLVMNKFDTATFAIFQYGAREFPLVVLMAGALSTAMIPEFSDAKNLKAALQALRHKSGKLMDLLFPVSILFLTCSKWLFPIVFNENFTESAAIFNIYMLLIISRLIFPHTILIGQKRTQSILMASVIELVANIGLSILFIEFWGITGVAFGTFFAYALQKLIWMVYVRKMLGINPDKYIPVKRFALYSALLIVAFCIVF